MTKGDSLTENNGKGAMGEDKAAVRQKSFKNTWRMPLEIRPCFQFLSDKRVVPNRCSRIALASPFDGIVQEQKFKRTTS